MKQPPSENLAVISYLEVVEIFDWLGDIVSGLGDAIGNAFGSISDKLIDGILNRIIQSQLQLLMNCICS